MNRRILTCLCAGLTALSFACSRAPSTHEEDEGGGTTLAAGGTGSEDGSELGGPRAGLTEEEIASFERGKALFLKRFVPGEGLGPFYNTTSCQACHSVPVTGGSAQIYMNFFLAVAGEPSHQISIAPFISPVVPSFGSGDIDTAKFTLEGGRPRIPDSYLGMPVVVAHRNAIPLFGVGFFEHITGDTIRLACDPDDADGDGISARFNSSFGGIGRFGVKAQANNIEVFTRPPLFNQMGITSNAVLGEDGIIPLGHAAFLQAISDPNAPTRDNDGVKDPEISRGDLVDLINFTRFLAAPQPLPFDGSARKGEDLFMQIGCAKCHFPELPSDLGPVRAFTDLLIHYMGPRLADGITFGKPQVSANDPPTTEAEFRTQPLWGVSFSAPFLHDGRAGTLDEAIRMHDGEAAAIRNAFVALTETERGYIIHFLESL